MKLFRRLTYRTEVVNLAKWLGLSNMLRKLYFWWARPKNGILSLELAGVKARFRIRTPEELRILESVGGAGGEHKVIAEVLGFLKAGDTVYDVGANVGLYTVLLSKTVGASGQVFAFEPEAKTCEHLQDNLKLNEVENVRWYRKALGDTSGKGSLFAGGIIGGGSLIRHKGDSQQGQVVDIVRGDDFVAADSLPTPRVVKIDVEGDEHGDIVGLQTTLSKPACEMLCCEVHPSMLPPQVTPSAVLSLVESLGFKSILQFPRWDKTFHIVARKTAA